MAIPLILASAVYFKKYVALTVVYYALIAVPLQILQYYEYTVSPIIQSDWWNVPGTSPPLFVSLSQIFSKLSSSIAQFRLYDISQVIYQITGQLTWIPNANTNGHNLGNAMTQYLDSAPGLIMFVVIVVGLALGGIFFSRQLIRLRFGWIKRQALTNFHSHHCCRLILYPCGCTFDTFGFFRRRFPGNADSGLR